MACKLAVQCNLMYEFLKCALPENTIETDLKVCMLKGIHTFTKDYMSQTSKCSPWGSRSATLPFPKEKEFSLCAGDK